MQRGESACVIMAKIEIESRDLDFLLMDIENISDWIKENLEKDIDSSVILADVASMVEKVRTFYNKYDKTRRDRKQI